MTSFLNRLDVKDFRLIHAIHQTGQLALSARDLSMTQPAASRMLAAIEKKIGEPVFVRHPKGMTPTAVGEILAQRSAIVLRNLEATEQEVLAISRGLAGAVHIGAVTGAVVAYVVPGIKKLKETTQGSEVHVDVGPSSMLIEGLLKGDYDFVLSRLPSGTETNHFSIQPARVEVLQALLRSNHPLAEKAELRLEDLQTYELVIQAPHTPMRQAIDDAFVARGIPRPAEIINTASLLVLISYLSSTDAIAPVTSEVATQLSGSSEHWTARPFDDPVVIRPYYLISRRHEPMNPLANRLHDIVAGLISDDRDS